LNEVADDEEEPRPAIADHRDLKQHEAGMKTADLCREHGIKLALEGSQAMARLPSTTTTSNTTEKPQL
jgi:hypothetical protein